MAQFISLRKFVSPEIVFGSGSRKLVSQYVKQFGIEKVLIVSDPGVIAAGWVVDVEMSLEESGISYATYTTVSPNPRAEEVMRGALFYKNQHCTGIIAVGGGSPMDCAKGIGIVSTNGADILDYEGVDKIGIAPPPLIFVPTTAGSSADVSQFAIISNPEERIKISIVSKTVVPDVALIDPDAIETVDSYLAACTGVDALVHAIEAYVSKGCGPMTDMYALEAIRLISKNLPELLTNSSSELRNKIMLGSMQAGLAFSNAILGAVHAMAHSLGGLLDLPHGECNALLLEHVIAFNFEASPERYRTIAHAMGVSTVGLSDIQVKLKLIEAIQDLKKVVGITNSLQTRGVNGSDIPELSRKALHDACMITNPREANQRDIETIFEEAL